MPDSAYQEYVLDAPDVCVSCFRPIRQRREKTTSGTNRSDVSVEKSEYTRVGRTTEIDHEPATAPTQSIAVWCNCGCQSAYDRYWDDGGDRALTMARFKQLLVHVIKTLEAKSVTLDREAVVRQAIGHYQSEHEFNAALEDAVEVGIQTAIASTESPGGAISA